MHDVLIGYVRTLQLLEPPFTPVARLLGAGCEAVYVEASSGDHLERPVLHRALEGLRAGDVLVIADEAGLSGNEPQMSILMDRIRRRNATLRVLDLRSDA